MIEDTVKKTEKQIWLMGCVPFFTQMGCYMPTAQLAIRMTPRHFKAVCFIGKASFCLAIDMGRRCPRQTVICCSALS